MLLHLIPHPDTPRDDLRVSVAWTATDGDEGLVTFRVAPADDVVCPSPTSPTRTDGLWRTTCAELFWRGDGAEGYREFNLSPSGAWAAYDFDGYRSGMREAFQAVPPHIEIERKSDALAISADVDFSGLPTGDARIALSMVIEHRDGTKSYWALAHPSGAPDFHHPDCFALKVPAVAAP